MSLKRPKPILARVTVKSICQEKAHLNNVLGLQAYQDRDWNKAIALFSRSILLDPMEPCYYFHKAESYLKVLDFESCIAHYKHFMTLVGPKKSNYVLSKRFAPIVHTWGQIQLDQHRYKNAYDTLDFAESLGIPPQECLLQKSYCLVGLEYYDEALEMIYQLTESDPSYSELYVYRSEIHKLLGNVDFASMDMQKAKELNPNHPNLVQIQEWITEIIVDLRNKAAQERLENHYKEAIWYYNHAIELDSRDWLTILKRGTLFAEVHSYENALEDFLTVLNHPDRDPTMEKQVQSQIGQVYKDLGKEAFKNKQYDDAVAHFTTGLTYDSSDYKLWRHRADCYFLQQEYELASLDLNRALILNSHDKELKRKYAASLFAIAVLEARGGMYKEAIEKFTKSIQVDSGVPDYYYERARCYYRLQVIEKAKSDLSKVLELEPTHSHASSLLSLLDGIIYQPFYSSKPRQPPSKTSSKKPSIKQTESIIDGWDSQSFDSVPLPIVPGEKKEIQLKRMVRMSSAKTVPSSIPGKSI